MTVTMPPGTADLGTYCDIEKMLCAAIRHTFQQLTGRTVGVVSATNVEADILATHGLPFMTVQAVSGGTKDTWQGGEIAYVWEVSWSLVGEGRDATLSVAADAHRILRRLPGVAVSGPGGGVFEGVEVLSLPAQSGQVRIEAQEITQFDGAVRVTVTPNL